MSTTEQLNELLCQEYALVPESESIDTTHLANAALNRLDPESITHILVRHAAFLQMKQMARAICRRCHAREEELIESGRLFDFELQGRYPQSHSAQAEGPDVYLPISQMTLQDFDYNIQRLEKEAATKQLHADALRQERSARLRAGMFAAA